MHASVCVCLMTPSPFQLYTSSLVSNCLHKAGPVPPPEEMLGHSIFSEWDKSAWSVNFSNTLLLCSNHSSANTQHLASRDCTPNWALLGTAESCFGSWDGLRTVKPQFPLLVGIRVRLSKWYLETALQNIQGCQYHLVSVSSVPYGIWTMLGKRLENIYCHCHSSLHQKSSGKRGNTGANAYTMGVCLGLVGRQVMTYTYYRLLILTLTGLIHIVNT